jgi:ribonucleoside-diphosphate reductase alpha chain
MGHIKMMGGHPAFISGAISKTVNVPKEATVDEIMQAYIQSWEAGAKASRSTATAASARQPLKHIEGQDGGRELRSRPRPSGW